MDLEETEARNDYAGEGQQQFNRQIDQKRELFIATTVRISNPTGLSRIKFP
jgi:hypothetical protein